MPERDTGPPIMTLARKAGALFAERGFDNGRLEGELLLASVLGLERLDLYLQFDRPMMPAELEEFRHRVRRRLRHEPLQYIVGNAHFRSLVLHVDSRVLIPRPETEVLVGEVLAWAAERSGQPADDATFAALDVGTGSGAIALSLVREGGFARVVATDASADALAVATGNAASLALGDRVEFRAGALWEPIRPEERFDVIVSNPPYVAESDRASLPADVVEWEPAGSLFAGEDGLAVLLALADGAPARLRSGGLLALEVGSGQAGAVAAHIRRSGCFEEPRIRRDLTGRERIVLATLPRSR